MAQDGWIPITALDGTGTPSEMEITGIPATYEHILLRGLISSSSSDSFPVWCGIKFNDVSSGYDMSNLGSGYAGAPLEHTMNYNQSYGAGSSNYLCYAGNTTTHGNLGYGYFEAEIFNYADTSRYTQVIVRSGYATQNTSGGTMRSQNRNGSICWRNTSAVTSIQLGWESAANFTADSNIVLYGFQEA